LPDRRHNFHWERAGRKFKLVGDELYDDEEAEHWAEEEMLTEAFSHWDEAGRVRRGRAPRRYRWRNAIVLRDLDTERQLSLVEMGLVLDKSSGTTRSHTKGQRAKKRKRAIAERAPQRRGPDGRITNALRDEPLASEADPAVAMRPAHALSP
jgi:hypothetical protein